MNISIHENERAWTNKDFTWTIHNFDSRSSCYVEASKTCISLIDLLQHMLILYFSLSPVYCSLVSTNTNYTFIIITIYDKQRTNIHNRRWNTQMNCCAVRTQSSKLYSTLYILLFISSLNWQVLAKAGLSLTEDRMYPVTSLLPTIFMFHHLLVLMCDLFFCLYLNFW